MPVQDKPKKSPTRVAALCAVFFLNILMFPSALLAVLLLLDGETWAGRLFASSWLALCVLGFYLYMSLRQRASGGTRVLASLGVFAALGFLACYLLAPSGVAPANSRLQSVFLGKGHYSRWTPPGLVPEMDQTKLGADLSPYDDALMTRAKGARMKALFMTAYQEMQQDPEFVAVGSVMGRAYVDAFGFPQGGCHLFSY